MEKHPFGKSAAMAAVMVILVFQTAPADAAGGTPAAVETPVQSGTAVDAQKRAGWETGAKVAYWLSNVDGDLRIDGNGIRGSTISLKDDLGISNAELGFVEIFGRFGRHRLTAGYLEADYSGSTIIPREIIAKGQTYPAGSLVEANLKLKIMELEYQHDFLRLENVLAGLSVGADPVHGRSYEQSGAVPRVERRRELLCAHPHAGNRGPVGPPGELAGVSRQGDGEQFLGQHVHGSRCGAFTDALSVS